MSTRLKTINQNLSKPVETRDNKASPNYKKKRHNARKIS